MPALWRATLLGVPRPVLDRREAEPLPPVRTLGLGPSEGIPDSDGDRLSEVRPRCPGGVSAPSLSSPIQAEMTGSAGLKLPVALSSEVSMRGPRPVSIESHGVNPTGLSRRDSRRGVRDTQGRRTIWVDGSAAGPDPVFGTYPSCGGRPSGFTSLKPSRYS